MSAFCFSPETIDLSIFDLWLKGLTVSEAASVRSDADPLLRDVIELDTTDHFRLFEELQPSLQEPRSTLCLLQASNEVRLVLSETYYAFDDAVVREFLSRKFTSRARKDLDEISEITGAPRRSCLRQFDNLKRLFDAGDETGFQIQFHSQLRLADQLAEEFNLPRSLTTRYEAILFLMHHRFNIPSGKKKTSTLGSLRDYEFCALAIMNAWCVKAPFQVLSSLRNAAFSYTEGPESPSTSTTGLLNHTGGTSQAIGDAQFSPFDFDATLFAKFRDLRARATPLVSEISSSVAANIDNANEKKRFESRFKAWFRVLFACATSKDLRDFFDDVIVNIVEPVIEIGCDAEKLFDWLERSVSSLFTLNDVQTWSSLIAGVKPCVVRFCSVHPQSYFLHDDFEGDDEK